MALVFINLLGCATINKGLKSLVGRSEPAPVEKKASKIARFSEEANVPYDGKNRKYQRMTREKFEELTALNTNER
jgi:hypothetical protein